MRLFVSGLSDPSAKVQVAALNMLNLALSQPDLTVRARAALSDVSRCKDFRLWFTTRWIPESPRETTWMGIGLIFCINPSSLALVRIFSMTECQLQSQHFLYVCGRASLEPGVGFYSQVRS